MAAPKLQLLSRTIYDTDGTTTEWDFNFSGGYLLPSHVKAYYENEFGFRTDVTVTEAMLIGEYQLRIAPALPAGSVLVIYRSTPKDAPMVNFMERGTVSEISLDTTAKQAVFVAAEAADEVNTVDWNKIMEAATEADASEQAAAASAAASAASATLADSLTQAAKAAVIASGTATAAAAATSASAAAASRTEANTAKDKAIAAVATALSGGEELNAISQIFHRGQVVKTLIYDTSKDSDMGAWRNRCQHTSWYNEPVQAGRWLGYAGGESHARTIGATLGADFAPALGTTTGWSPSAAATVELDDNGLALVTTVSGNIARTADYTLTGLTVGQPYKVSATISGMVGVGGLTGRQHVATRNAANTADLNNGLVVSTSGSDVFYQFTASTTSHKLRFRWDGDSATQPGDKVILSNLKIAPITAFNVQAGDYYQHGVDEKFYSLNEGVGQTEVFRGNARGFPAIAGLVIEANRFVIYDLTAPGCPMWMVTKPITDGLIRGSSDGISYTSVAALDGRIVIGGMKSDTDPVWSPSFRFVSDTADIYGGIASGSRTNVIKLADRNTLPVYAKGAPAPVIANNRVRDVAITVMDGAPIDPSTGLPVPTIAFATIAGVSVVSHDGAVYNSTSTADIHVVRFTPQRLIFTTGSSGVVQWAPLPIIASGYGLTLYAKGGTIPSFVNDYASRRLCPAERSTINTASTDGVTHIHENVSTPAKGMLAMSTAGFTTGWMVGDSRGALLADTVAEVITEGPNLVANGTFDTDLSEWLINENGTSTAVWSAGTLAMTGDGTNTVNVSGAFATVPGAAYRAYFDVATSGVSVGVSQTQASNYINPAVVFNAGTQQGLNFTAVGATTYINFLKSSATTTNVDNVRVVRIDADRSVKANGLNIIGSITKGPVAAGAQLQWYRGANASTPMNTANFLEQPYSADKDYSTGDFHYMWWELVASAGSQTLRFDRAAMDLNAGKVRVVSGSTGYEIHVNGTGYATNIAQTAGLHFAVLSREAGVLKLYIDSALVWSATNAGSVTNTSAVLRIGTDCAAANAWSGTTMALFRTGATAPTADQIAKIYRDELALFQPGAQCTLPVAGSVIALAYDESTGLLHTAQANARAEFNNLLRVGSEAQTVGGLLSIDACGGVILNGGYGSKVYQPSMRLRDELCRKAEARYALGKEPVFKDYTATASQATFVAPKGYKVKAVYVAGILKRGFGNDYTLTDDGFQQSVVFGTGLSVNTWVNLMLVRA